MAILLNWIRQHRTMAVLILLAAAGVAFLLVNQWRGPVVDVAIARAGPLEHSIVVSGRVQAPHRIELGSVVTGRVEKVLVEEGAKVEAGQPLILLDTSELQASAAQARAAEAAARARLAAVRELTLPQANDAVTQAEAQYRFAEAEYKRNRDLRDKGFIGEARLQDIERLLAVAKSQLDARARRPARRARAGAGAGGGGAPAGSGRRPRLAEAKLAQATIRASVPGTVLVRAVEPGDIVSPGKRLMVLNSAEETRLIAQVDEKNLPFLREGQEAVASAMPSPTGNSRRGCTT